MPRGGSKPKHSPEQLSLIETLWNKKRPIIEIATAFHLSVRAVSNLAFRNGWPKRKSWTRAEPNAPRHKCGRLKRPSSKPFTEKRLPRKTAPKHRPKKTRVNIPKPQRNPSRNLPPIPSTLSEQEQIAEFLRTRGVTKLPARYAITKGDDIL